jgi:ParB family chromosome partitioning protein
MTTTTLTKPELVLVDANEVIIETNVRDESTRDTDFLTSVEAFGILTPVSGRRDSTGQIHIRIGQRRTLAARATGTPLPVIVFEADSADAPEPAWLRTAIQLVENDHRKNLTGVQRAAAYQQMEIDGLSIPKIAGKLGVTKEIVKAGISVANHPAATELFREVNLDLIQMASIAEFDADPDTVGDLIETALEYPQQFEHAVERARRAKASTELIATRVGVLRTEGTPVLSYDEYRECAAEPLTSLIRDDAVTVDPELGDGIATVVQTNYQGELHEFAVIIDPTLYGYKNRYGNSSQANSGPMTEAQKEERRQLIANNKAWLAAEAVRRAWLTEFLSRKSLPKDAAAFIAIALTRFPYEVERGSQITTHELLGVEPKSGMNGNALAEIVENNASKAGLITLALVISKLEDSLSKETWRSVANGHAVAPAKFYFLYLRDWRYNLSRIESVVMGEGSVTPDSNE